MKLSLTPALKPLMGLAFALALVLGAQAQPIKGLQNATKTVTQPMKDVQKTTKEVVQPIKDTRKAVNEVTKAPKAVEREINATEKSINQAGNEVKKAKEDIDRTVDKLDGDKAKKDSTKTDSLKGNGKTIASEESSGRYGVTSSRSASPTTSTGQAAPADDNYRRVLLPPAKGKTNIKGGNGGAAAAPTAAPKPDYSGSPAREALESADFATETLNDLFTYAEWEGPEQEHTMRSVDYMLKQLRHDIDEIRVKDPERSVWSYEKKYRDWRNTYLQHGGK
jgi:ABC-type transporter Mla subunit MlaD